MLIGGALCNDARLQVEEGSGGKKFHALGDPTEGALVVAAAKFGLMKADLDEQKPRIDEFPFDSDRKRMSTLHSLNHSEQSITRELLKVAAPKAAYISFTKGAVDGLLEVSTHVWENGARHPLTPEYRERIDASNRSLAAKGMRVLGVAFKTFEKPQSGEALETDLSLIHI